MKGFITVHDWEARDATTGLHVKRVQALGKMLGEGIRDLGLHAAQLSSIYFDHL